jgi:hypothetical protein
MAALLNVPSPERSADCARFDIPKSDRLTANLQREPDSLFQNVTHRQHGAKG